MTSPRLFYRRETREQIEGRFKVALRAIGSLERARRRWAGDSLARLMIEAALMHAAEILVPARMEYVYSGWTAATHDQALSHWLDRVNDRIEVLQAVEEREGLPGIYGLRSNGRQDYRIFWGLD